MMALIKEKIFNDGFEIEIKDAELVGDESAAVIGMFNVAFNYPKKLYLQPAIADTVHF